MLTSIAREEVQRLQRDESAQQERVLEATGLARPTLDPSSKQGVRAAAIYRESIAVFDGE